MAGMPSSRSKSAGRSAIRFPLATSSVMQDWLCTRMGKQLTTGVLARNSAALSASPSAVFAPVTTKTGAMARKTGDVLNTKPSPRTTAFPLTAPVSLSREHTRYAPSAKDTTPALRLPARNGYGCVTEIVWQTSIRWPTSLLWLLLWPPFYLALTPTAHPNPSAGALDGDFHMALSVRSLPGLGFVRLWRPHSSF